MGVELVGINLPVFVSCINVCLFLVSYANINKWGFFLESRYFVEYEERYMQKNFIWIKERMPGYILEEENLY